MNLNLIAYPGLAKEIAQANIEQRIQVPHVPLKFNSSPEDFDLVAIVEKPESCLERADGSIQHEMLVYMYNKVIEDSINAKYIYLAEDVINKTDEFVIDLFDRLNLDEENYKTKTGRPSLRNDVINKVAHVESNRISDKKATIEGLDLTKSTELYNTIKEKAIKL
jgi:hypothetical protein